MSSLVEELEKLEDSIEALVESIEDTKRALGLGDVKPPSSEEKTDALLYGLVDDEYPYHQCR